LGRVPELAKRVLRLSLRNQAPYGW
jgi:hypothetical protein